VCTLALREVACDGDTLNIECLDGDKIRVMSANYGRRDNDTCSDAEAFDKECVHADTLQFAQDR